MKNLVRMATLLVASCLLFGVVASSAMAEVVGVTYNASAIKFTESTVTVKKNGAEPRSCTLHGASGTAAASGGYMEVWNSETYRTTELLCPPTEPGLTLDFDFARGTYDTTTGVYSLQLRYREPFLAPPLRSPWGNYTSANPAAKATWTNGSGTTPSSFTFNEALLGTISGGAKITISGTIKAATLSGGLLTMSH